MPMFSVAFFVWRCGIFFLMGITGSVENSWG